MLEWLIALLIVLGIIAMCFFFEYAEERKWNIQALRSEIRWRRRPLVYVDEHNGSWGVVSAKDYSRAWRKAWRSGDYDFYSRVTVRPIFYFNRSECLEAACGCRVLPGSFVVEHFWSEPSHRRPFEDQISGLWRHLYGKRRAKKMLAERAASEWYKTMPVDDHPKSDF